jgi:hypothetical protein
MNIQIFIKANKKIILECTQYIVHQFPYPSEFELRLGANRVYIEENIIKKILNGQEIAKEDIYLIHACFNEVCHGLCFIDWDDHFCINRNEMREYFEVFLQIRSKITISKIPVVIINGSEIYCWEDFVTAINQELKIDWDGDSMGKFSSYIYHICEDDEAKGCIFLWNNSDISEKVLGVEETEKQRAELEVRMAKKRSFFSVPNETLFNQVCKILKNSSSINLILN